MSQVTPTELAERVSEWRDDARSALRGLYGTDRGDRLLVEIVDRAVAAAKARPEALAELDRRRERDRGWYLDPRHVGYSAYADRLGGTLAGVEKRIEHLRDVGVTMLHLMSVLRGRPGDSDGGYAVEDYRTPEPALGTVEDLRRLAAGLRDAGISLCLDLVMNHTSDTHEWAGRARAGSAYHRALYRTFEDRTLPDRYEATLPEVFPEMAPGNFTWDEELGRWVWTTFRSFQWDLDWSNPDVLLEMLDVVFHLAGLGVDVIRLDAVAFTWKRVGTDGQNQPEAHLIAQALRAAVAIAAPATILLAEAIVGPDELVGYLGGHELARRECHIAYHNQLMVHTWSMVAMRDAALATLALGRLPEPPPHTTWITYVRCHDDIGWAVSDRDATAAGLDGWSHRRFLAAFHRGEFPGSWARGTPFSANPATGDERTCGMTAALCGITAAVESGDAGQLDEALARFRLLYAIAFGYGGIPLVYMGDELAQPDDLSYLADPHRTGDSRWRHRPAFDDRLDAERQQAGRVAARAWSVLQELVAARRACPPLHGNGRTHVLDTGPRALFAWVRSHDRFGRMVGVANVGEHLVWLPDHALAALGSHHGADVVDLLAPQDRDVVAMAPRQVRWLTADADYRTVPTPP